MLVYAGRYLAAKSALNGPVVIIDFGSPISPPVEIASISYDKRGKGFALDPERSRLYVLTRSNTGSEGWVSWIDAGFFKLLHQLLVDIKTAALQDLVHLLHRGMGKSFV